MLDEKPDLSTYDYLHIGLLAISKKDVIVKNQLEEIASKQSNLKLIARSRTYYEYHMKRSSTIEHFVRRSSKDACDSCQTSRNAGSRDCIFAVVRNGEFDSNWPKSPPQLLMWKSGLLRCISCYLRKQSCNVPDLTHTPAPRPQRCQPKQPAREIERKLLDDLPVIRLAGPRKYFEQQLYKLKFGHPEHRKFERLLEDLDGIEALSWMSSLTKMVQRIRSNRIVVDPKI
ncbi:uncharacterized protein L201_000130 [Kwoniella dendrophila CBS 6074]|uniref:Integrase zinc-binding domain-containing protein n=1 Tax=Kwoniella dendrophila CBS 6074 TaxID=1295534 RepID=A0AAX4JK61_9TREE